MKNSLLILFLLFTGLGSPAQLTETVRIPAGTDFTRAISIYGIYRFPAFTDGIVYFKDGSTDKALMNYNIPNDQVVFIDKEGDTLALASPETVARIAMGGNDFYYWKKGYMEEVAVAAAGSLVMKRTILVHAEKKGAFGMPDATSSIDSYATYDFSNSSYPLLVDQDLVVKKTTAFFLATGKNRPLPATEDNFLFVFSNNRKKITGYLNSHRVNFNRQEDIVQLFDIAAAPR